VVKAAEPALSAIQGSLLTRPSEMRSSSISGGDS
jgi:hypothetical protein